ncbi:amidase domain-containing protein [Paenalkalicoccus suaedae]|nr:amidase domain-containing protein [Paenalkalicoccus suaedae]
MFSLETYLKDKYRRQMQVESKGWIKHDVHVDVLKHLLIEDREYVECLVHEVKVRMEHDHVYMEQQKIHRAVIVEKDQVLDDYEVISSNIEVEMEPKDRQDPLERVYYDRVKAVQYAEMWWDGRNPQYHAFTNDCTNFISQCLRAGGAPMRGMPSREQGWWYDGNLWSFSWSVAHSMMWYLKSSRTGLRASEKQDVRELSEGDIICYDFDGNGRFQHTTIIVAFTADGEALVNAHTSDSRMRHWSYEDSTAWTENCRYVFFHIED